MQKILLAALSGSVIALCATLGHAGDITAYKPTTAAGGAPVDPTFWDNQAAVSYKGAGATVNNVTIAPTASNSTYNDYSSRPTTVTGDQTNVTAQGDLQNGGEFTVTTQGTDGQVQSNPTQTSVVSSATLGDGSTSTTTTNTGN